MVVFGQIGPFALNMLSFGVPLSLVVPLVRRPDFARLESLPLDRFFYFVETRKCFGLEMPELRIFCQLLTFCGVTKYSTTDILYADGGY